MLEDMKKIFSILALTLVALTASAKSDVFNLKDATATADKHGQVTFLVNGTSTETAAEGQTVTVSIVPAGGYIVTSVSNLCTTSWGGARAASMDMLNSVEMTKVNDNTYTFTMPRADVDVTVEYNIEIPTPAEDKKDEEKEVTDVKMDMEPAGAPEPVGEITIIPVSITGVEVPATAPQEIVIKVAASTQVGNNVFVVREIKADAFKTNDANVKVTKVILPDTEEPLTVEAGAMKPNGKPIDVQTPLALLDDYALMNNMKENYEAKKVTAKATAPERFWTFSSGVDVVVPEGVTVYRAFNDNGNIRILPIEEANQSKIIKANNGVLLSCDEMKGGKAYEFVANPSGPKSGTKPATTDAKSYEGNSMEPVIEAKNYASGQYLIVKNNEFHTIANNGSKVPACKAVFNKNK